MFFYHISFRDNILVSLKSSYFECVHTGMFYFYDSDDNLIALISNVDIKEISHFDGLDELIDYESEIKYD